MNRDEIIRMAKEAAIYDLLVDDVIKYGELELFAALVADAEREAVIQAITDPENQPSQYGTVTIDYMDSEVATVLQTLGHKDKIGFRNLTKNESVWNGVWQILDANDETIDVSCKD